MRMNEAFFSCAVAASSWNGGLACVYPASIYFPVTPAAYPTQAEATSVAVDVVGDLSSGYDYGESWAEDHSRPVQSRGSALSYADENGMFPSSHSLHGCKPMLRPSLSSPDEHNVTDRSTSSVTPEQKCCKNHQSFFSTCNDHMGVSLSVKLENSDIWRQFNNVGTEMVITKAGRRMFPPIKLSITGLIDFVSYSIMVDMVPVDDCRYTYNNSHWSVMGKAEVITHSGFYWHPESPASGHHWTTDAVSFHKLKLTNNKNNKKNNNNNDNNDNTNSNDISKSGVTNCDGHLLVSSMQRFQPRIHIIQTSHLPSMCHIHRHQQTINRHQQTIDRQWQTNLDSQIFDNSSTPCFTFIFPETAFMAVTAYQNERVTKLKIDHNPFARGFRSALSKTQMQ